MRFLGGLTCSLCGWVVAGAFTFLPGWRSADYQDCKASAKKPSSLTAPLRPRLRLGDLRFRQGAYVCHLAFFPDGKHLVSTGVENRICFWDVRTGKLVRQFHCPGGAGLVAVCPDGKTIAVGGLNGSLSLCSMAGGGQQRLPGHHLSIEALAFSRCGRLLASGGFDSTVRITDTVTKKCLRTIREHSGPVHCVAFSSSGAQLATAGADGMVYLLDVSSGKVIHEWGAQRGAIYSVAFNPTGETLAAGGENGVVRLWDARCGRELFHSPPIPGGIFQVAVAPDGRYLIVAGGDGKLYLWDLKTGRPLTPFSGHAGPAFSLAFSPCGRILASGGRDNAIRLWEFPSGKPFSRDKGHRAAVEAVSFAPDGAVIASAGADGNFLLWDRVSGREVRRFRTPPGSAPVVVFSPGGKSLACFGGGPNVWLLNRATGTIARQFEGHRATVNCLAFAPAGRWLASGDENGEIIVWQPDSCKIVRRLTTTESVLAIAFSPCGRFLASAASGGRIRLWELETGESKREFSTSNLLPFLCFSPDGKMLILTTGEAVELWETVTGGLFRRWKLEGPVGFVTFSPAGKLAVALSDRPEILFWDPLSGERRRLPNGHRGRINSLSFSPDGKTLATASSDTTILLWDVVDQSYYPHVTLSALSSAEFARCWESLNGENAGKAFKAIRALVAARDQAVAFLRTRVKPVTRVSQDQLNQLLRDLASNRFKSRQKATQELERLAERADAALRQALARAPALDTRVRIERLLAGLHGSRAPSRKVLAFRITEVLEHIGSRPAIRLLEALADGAPDAYLTQQAQRSLTRHRGGKANHPGRE